MTDYGAAYAVASLSCTIGPVLALTTSALRSASLPGGLGVFLAYAAGMGLVVGVLTLATALARDSVITRLRRALPYVSRAGGALLVIGGTYVAYYGWYETRVLAGGDTTDPVITTALRAQRQLTRWLDTIGSGRIPGVFAVLTLITLAGVIAAARRDGTSSPNQDRAPASPGRHTQP